MENDLLPQVMGTPLQVFGRILYTDDVADPENLLLTPAQSSWALDLHYYFFFLANISKTAITCCFWTLLF